MEEDADASAIAALLASSVDKDEASLSIDLTIEPLFSEREFFVFSLDKEDSKLFSGSLFLKAMIGSINTRRRIRPSKLITI
jgi:hypothetical protein